MKETALEVASLKTVCVHVPFRKSSRPCGNASPCLKAAGAVCEAIDGTITGSFVVIKGVGREAGRGRGR